MVCISSESNIHLPSYYFRLNEVNATVSILCTRTCNTCNYTDHWIVQLIRNFADDRRDLWRFVNGSIMLQSFNEMYPELYMKMIPAQYNCTASENVSSILNIVLKSINTTTEALIISCGLEYGEHFRTYTLTSALVYLPSAFGDCPTRGTTDITTDSSSDETTTITKCNGMNIN